SHQIEAAARLHRRAVEVAATSRSAEAGKLLRTALRTLPVASGHLEATAVRIRVLLSLALADAETGSLGDGLVHLGTASDLVDGLPESIQRTALRGLVDSQ